ncbi:MAG: 3-hydroxyacyl-ACP dehydratase FabZ [Clostridiales bacterium]|jgi:3-hydroxyacyl-[acyl-carrier-protein] dehydratase|nr:3-hydroxyacyl-ACP dehydratase FabZ [Clostridiales bacterium]
MEPIDINGIMAVIPHRPPFLLIDRIIELETGKKAAAIKNVTMNEAFFGGHFPRKPVMPGVLIVEAMAQTGAFALLSAPEYQGKLAFFGALNNVKFRRLVTPGDTLNIEVELVKLKKNAGIGKGVAMTDGKKACEGEFTFMIS